MIKCDKLVAGYTGKFMLNEVSFDIKKGSFTGIVGPNGSGKTTLFRALTGELLVQQGSIIFNEKNIVQLSGREKAQQMAIVTQNLDIPDMTVEDYVLMGRLPYRKPYQLFENREDYAFAHKFMKLTGSYKLKDKLMSELSGGEQQLASIARALCQEPALLLLDEPTSHLDISHQVQILNLIQQLNEEMGLTVLMIIHDLNLAGEYCDYLIMMNHGKVYTQGKPEETLFYKHIEDVYKTVVITQENPLSKKRPFFWFQKRC
jgi:iron complex transport system ATP-binding protein